MKLNLEITGMFMLDIILWGLGVFLSFIMAMFSENAIVMLIFLAVNCIFLISTVTFLAKKNFRASFLASIASFPTAFCLSTVFAYLLPGFWAKLS